MTLSIIIPLYNERATIIKVLERIFQLNLDLYVSEWEIIIVDDCSTDSVEQLIQEFLLENTNVKYFKHDKNQGKGSAIRTGVSHSKGEYLLFQDADLELYPEDIPSMLHAVKELGVDFVNGSRYMPGVIRPVNSYYRYLGNKIFSSLTSSLINCHVTDMACGYKMIKRDLYLQINPKEERFGIEAELILKALKINKQSIAEVPVRYKARTKLEGKKLNGLDAFKIFLAIFKISFLGKNS